MSAATPVPFPGFDSPAVGFDQPFEMLLACHQRVRRSLELLARLVTHIDTRGHDEQSRSAASDVLRYFDRAAPLHHQDEELHVFPALMAHELPSIHEVIQQLQSDHTLMEALWSKVREHLLRWTQANARENITGLVRNDVAQFRDIYDAHIQTEEDLIFPVAQTLMSEAALAEMSRAMQARRMVH